MLIKRELYLKKLKLFLDKPLVKVLTGLRRVGKSSILLMLQEYLKHSGVPQQNILTINKESLEFDFIRNYTDLYQHVGKSFKTRKGKKYILIDEIQEIESWEKAVTSFLSEGMGDIVITGSNAHLLSSELASLLTGRYVEIPVLSLSLTEFLKFRNITKDDATDKDFNMYLRYGGLPGVHLLPLRDDAVFPYLNSVMNTILLKDVVKRHRIRDVSQLERITAFLFDNCGNVTTAKSIADYLKSQRTRVSVDTVQGYLEYLVQAFLTCRVRRYDLKGKRHLEFFDKYYMSDVGLRHGFIGYREKDVSGLLENIVFLELLRRGYRVSVGVLDGAEIDFIAESQKKKFYVQVCYLLADAATVKREFGNLEKIRDNYPKLVLSLDTRQPEERDGIKHLNIMNFLLNER